jgi:hypothetical protein
MGRLVLSLLLRFCEGIGLPSGMAPDAELGIPERHGRSR